MYANSGYNTLWEDDDVDDYYGSASVASDGDDSGQELRDLEELLYSHIHYEPNYLCKAGTSDEISCSDVDITQLNDGVLGGLDNISGSALEQENCATGNNADSEVIVIDAEGPKDEVTCDSSHSVTGNLLSEQLKRKATSCKVSESADEVRTKCKKVDVSGCPGDVALESTSAENTCSLNLLDNAASVGISDSGKQEVCQPNGQRLAKKKLKMKCKSGISHAAAAAELIVLDSTGESSSSSSDVFCGDMSSEELSSDGADDIKLSNINVTQTDDADALADVLSSLPDCHWDVNAQDRAAGTTAISRYYTQLTSRARCVNCNERGHFARDCTQPKKLLACILCGVRGHMARSCPDSLCFNCHQSGHAIRDCDRRRIRNEMCRRCRMRGHIQMECPDRWRQYHLTTRPGPIVTSKTEKVERKFCYNCGASGHFGHECNEDRMNSFSLPTLPFIARYDTNSAATSPSAPCHKKRKHSKTDTREHKQKESSPGHRHHAHVEKRHDRNIHMVYGKARPPNSNSHCSFVDVDGKVNISSHSSHQVSTFDKRGGEVVRYNSSLHSVIDFPRHQKDSFGSKDKHHSSTGVSDNRFRESVNGKQLAFRGRKSEHRRSSSAGSRSQPFGSSSREVDCPVFQGNLSSNMTALKKKMEKKLRWIKSLPHDAPHQHTRNEARGMVKTPVHTEPLTFRRDIHKKKTQPLAMKRDEFTHRVASYGDNQLEKNRRVIRTARGFLMTVDNR